MSYCLKKTGPNQKDTIIFATEEDHKKPSTVVLPEPEPSPGLILPDGSINWNCPCLGGMATGPCGVEFRNAFSCFHYSEAEPKGSDCYEIFKTMQDCMQNYPTLYNKDLDDGEDELAGALEESERSSAQRDSQKQSSSNISNKIEGSKSSQKELKS